MSAYRSKSVRCRYTASRSVYAIPKADAAGRRQSQRPSRIPAQLAFALSPPTGASGLLGRSPPSSWPTQRSAVLQTFNEFSAAKSIFIVCTPFILKVLNNQCAIFYRSGTRVFTWEDRANGPVPDDPLPKQNTTALSGPFPPPPGDNKS